MRKIKRMSSRINHKKNAGNSSLHASNVSSMRRHGTVAGALVGLLAASLSGQAYALDPNALPTDGSITSGSGSISQAGANMTVNQATQQMIANWGTFNIGQNAAVAFVQPNAQAVALNRVSSSDASVIMGSLTANGQVFLINPNGVIFGSTAKVDVQGLVASTLDITNSDFLSGNYRFTNGGAAGSILNQGEINAADGGYVVMLAPEVINEGIVTARMGTVALASGNAVTMDMAGDGLINIVINEGAANALASNKGLIKADGGLVYMGARGAGDLAATVVNNEGIIEAQGLVEREGRIFLIAEGDGALASNTGTLDTRRLDNGAASGFVEISGDKVRVSGTITSGTLYIDPDFVNIANSGGDVDVATIEASSVAGTTVVIEANKGITIQDLSDGDNVINGGSGSIVLSIRNGDNDAMGNIAFANNASGITTTTGSIILDAKSDTDYTVAGAVAALLAAPTGTASVITAGTLQNIGKLTTSTGQVVLLAGASIAIANDITTTGGNVTAHTNSGTGAITQANISDISTGTGNLILRSGGSLSTITGSTIDSTQVELTSGNAQTVSIAGNLTADGTVNINSTGAVSIDGIIAADAQTINFNNMTSFVTNGSVNAGVGTINILPSNNATIGIGGPDRDVDITEGNLNAMTAGTINIGAGATTHVISLGTLTPDGGYGTLNINAGAAGSINQSGGTGTDIGGVATIVNLIAGAGVGTAGTPVLFDATGGGAGTFNVNTSGGAGNVYIRSSDVVGVDLAKVSVTTAGGSAQTVVIGSAGNIVVAGAEGFGNDNLTLRTNDTTIGAAITTTGSITVEQDTAANTLTLGGADAAGVVTDTELDFLVAPVVRLGRTDGGALSLAGNISAGNGTTTTLHLKSGGTIADGAFDITVTNLAVTAGGTVTLDTVTNSVTDFAASAGANNVTFTNAGSINVGVSVDGVVGITGANIDLESVAGAITQSAVITATGLSAKAATGVTLTTATNNITNLSGSVTGAGNFAYTDADSFTVADNNGFGGEIGVTTANGTISLTATTGTLTNSSAISSAASNLDTTLSANDMVLAGGTITAGTGRVTLKPTTAATAIDVGAANAGVTGLELSDAELDTITAGVLHIGSATAGQIDVSAAITPLAATTLTLQNNAAVTDNAAAGTLTVANLRVTSAGAVTLDNANDVDNVSIQAGGAVAFTDSDGFTITTVDTQTSSTSTAGMTFTATTGGIVVASTGVANEISAAGAVLLFANGDDQTLNIAAGADVATSAGGVTLRADQITLAGTVTAAAQTVTLRSAEVADAIDVGVGATDVADSLGISNAEIGQISAGTILIGNAAQVGGIEIVGNVSTDAEHLTLTSGGAITWTAGTLSTGGTGDLSLNAVSGIGTGAAAVDIGAVGGSLSVNNTTSNDVYLTTDAITLGSGTTSIIQGNAAGTLSVVSSDAIVVGGDISVGTFNGAGTIILDATTTLTRTGGTVTAGTVNLDGASVGANGAAIQTATDTLVATSGAGAIYVANANSTTADIAATGGLVDFQNTGTVTTAGAGITSSNNNVTVNATGLVTVSAGDTVGGANALIVSVTGVGVTNDGLITGDTSVTIAAGANTFTQSATGDVTIDDGAGTITITADAMAIDALSTINSGTGLTTLKQTTNGQLINLGAGDIGGTLGLTNAEIDTVTAGTLHIGNASTGAVTISADITPANTTTLHIQGASVDGTAGGIIVTNLAITSAGTVNMIDANNAVTNLAISAAGQPVTYTDSNGLTIADVDGLTSTVGSAVTITATGAALNVNHNVTASGALALNGTDVTIGNAITASGATGVTIDANTGTFTNQGVVSSTDSAISITADKMALGTVGTADSINAGTATVTLANKTVGGAIAIDLGAVGDGTAGTIELSDPELDTVTAGVLKIGSATAGAINVSLAIDTANTSTLHLKTGAGVTQAGGATITEPNLAIEAGTAVTLTENNAVTSLAISAAGQAVQFTDVGGVEIAEIDSVNGIAADSLVLISTGAITDDATADIAVTSSASFSGTSITLGDQAGNTTNFGTFTFSSAGAVVITEDTDTAIAGANTALSLDLNSGGAITDVALATMTVTNLADFAGTSITLDNAAAHAFGTLTFNSVGAVAITENDGTNIAGVNTALSLDLNSGGAIVDEAGADITVTNLADFAGTSITLDEAAAHDFGTLTFNSVGAVAITEASGTNIAGVNTALSLDLNSGGAIVDEAGADITVTNLADFAGTSITLDEAAAHDFGTLTFNSVGAVAITEASDTAIAGANTALSLDLNSGGAITDVALATMTVTNLADFAGTSITLDNAAAHAFGTLTFNSVGAVAITETDGTDIAGANTALSLDLNSGGAITDVALATMTVTNLADFAGTSITLDSAAAHAFGTLTFNSVGAVAITETDGTDIVGANTALSLDLNSGGAITDAAATSLAVTNNASFNGTSITLGDNGGDTTNFGTLTANASAGAISISENTTMNVVSAIATTTVALTSETGAIEAVTPNNAVADISGTAATLVAVTGIGAAGSIDTAVSTLSFTNSTSGAVDLTNTMVTGLTVSGTNEANGAITVLETSGTMTVAAADIISAAGGTITLNTTGADKAVISVAGSDVVSNGGAINVIADQLQLGGTLDSGVGLVTIKPNAPAQNIALGTGAVDDAATLAIDNTELLNIISTGGLTIGNNLAQTGNITVVGAGATTNVTGGTVLLRSTSGNINIDATLTTVTNADATTSGGNITFGAAGRINAGANDVNLTAAGGTGAIVGNAAAFANVVANDLTATADAGIGVADAIETQVDTIAFSNVLNAVQFVNTKAGGVTVSGSNGAGAVNVTETAGNLTIGTDDILTSSGVVTLTAQAADADIISADGSTIITTGSGSDGAAVNLIADNLLLGGTVAAGTATVTLKPFDVNQEIQVGVGATDDATYLGVTDVEANLITAATLTIGSVAQVGDITVVGNLPPASVTTLELLAQGAGGAIVDNTAGTAYAGILTATNVTLRAADGIGVSRAGVYNPIAVQTTTSAGLTATNSTNGDISLVQPTGNLSVGTGGATITNSANDGAIDLTTLVGNIAVDGTLQTAGNGAIYLDAQGATSDVTMTAASIVRSGAAGAGTGAIQVLADDDITLAQVMNAGTVTLTAGRVSADGTITDNNGAINNVTATTLNATADTMIGNVNTTGGGSVIVGPTDALETAITNLAVTLTAAGDVAIDNTLAGTLSVTGVTLGVAAGNDVWIRNSQSLNASGIAATLMNAGNANNVGLIATAGTLTLPNSSIDVSTGTLNLQGSTDIANFGNANTITATNLLFKSGDTETATATVNNVDGLVTGTTDSLTLTLTPQSGGTVNIVDLDSDGNSMRVADGNLTLTVNAGNLSVANAVSATDNTDNATRAGLIDIQVNGGNFSMASGSITSTNNVDADANGGLGADPTNQVAIRLRLDAVDATRSISIGNGAGISDTTITADGGDILIDAMTTAVVTGGNTRMVWIQDDASVAAYNGAADPITGSATIQGKVTIDGTFNTHQSRAAKLVGSSANITIGEAGVTGSGNLTLSAGPGFDVIVQDGGSITVTADPGVADGNLIINNSQNFTMQGDSEIRVDGSATINVTGNVALSDVTIDADHDGTPFAGGPATLSVTAGGSVTLNGLIDANAAAADLNTVIISAGTSITDGNAGALNITDAYSVTLTAGTGGGTGGIGTIADPIEIDAIRVTATNSGTGALALVNSPSSPAGYGAGDTAVTILGLTNNVAGGRVYFEQTGSEDLVIDNGVGGLQTVISANNGRIDINANGDITVNDNILSGGGEINIDPIDVTVNAVIDSAGGNVVIEADNNITFTAGGQVLSGGGRVTIEADLDDDGAGSVTFNVAGTDATDNAIVYSNGGRVDVLGETVSLHNFAIGADVGRVDVTAGKAEDGTAAGTITSGGVNGAGAAITGGTINLIATNDTNGSSIVGAVGNNLEVAPATILNVTGKGSATDMTVNLATTGAMPLGEIKMAAGETGTLGTVTLASAAAITDANGATTNVTATALAASAAGGIDLDTNVTSITATTSAVGDINISETTGIILTNVDSNNGTVTVVAGGSITVVTVDAANGANTVSLTANNGGSITDNGDNANSISGSTVTLQAANTIVLDGAGGDSTVDAATINAVTTGGTGTITIVSDATGGLNYNNVVAAAGAITLTSSGGAVTATNVVANGGGDTDDVTIATTGQQLTVNTITASTLGDVIITSGAVVDDGNNATRITANQLSINAGANAIGAADEIDLAVDEILLVSGAQVNLGELNGVMVTSLIATGQLDLVAGGIVTIANGGVSAAGQTVNLTGSAINGTPAGGADVTSAALNLVATSGGIGATTQLEITATGVVNAISTPGGNIDIESIGALSLGNFNAGTGNINLVSSGDITDGNADTLNDAGYNLRGAAATITSAGAVGSAANRLETTLTDLTINATATTVGIAETNALNILGITASDVVDITASGLVAITGITTSNDSLTINAGTGDITQSGAIELGTGAITLTGGAITLAHADNTLGAILVNAGTGNVSIREDAAMVVTSITHTGDISLTSAGSITGGDQETTLTVNVTATGNKLTASAAGAIVLDTEVAEIVATTSAAGAITLYEKDGVTLTNVTASNGPVTVNAGGAVLATGAVSGTVVSVESTGSSVTLAAATATAGDIIVTADTNVTLNGALDASAAITVVATTGSLTQNAGATMLAGTDINLDAATAIALNDTLVAGNDVLINQAGGVASVTINSTIDAVNDVTINSDDFVTVRAAVTADSDSDDAGAVTITAANAVLATAALSGASVTVESTDDSVTLAAVTATDGDIGVTADIDVILNGALDASAAITVVATTGSLTQNAGATMLAGTDINLDAATAIALNDTLIAGNDVLIGQAGGLTLGSVTINSTIDAVNDVTINSDDFVTVSAAVTADSDSDDVGAVTITAANAILATAALSGASVTVESTDDSVTLAAVTATDGDIGVTADIDVILNGALDASAAITVAATTGSLTQNAGGTMDAGTDINLDAATAIALNDTLVAGNDVLINQAGGVASVTINGTIDAVNDITISSDDFVTVSAAVTADSDSDDVGAVTITAANAVLATAALSGASVTVESTDDSVTLAAVTATDGDIGVAADINVTLNGLLSAVGNTVMVTATNGSIIDGNGGAVNVTAEVLTATAATGIELDTMVASITITDNTGAASNTVIREADGIDFVGATSIDGNFILTANGLVSDTGTLAITGTTSLTAGAGNNIILDSANNFGGAVTIVSDNNVTLNDTDAISFGGVSTVSGNLVVTAAGTITDGAAGTLAVTGTTSLTAGAGNDITLDNGNNFGGDVTIVSGRHVTLNDLNAIEFGGASTISGNLVVTAAGAITDDAAGTLAITGTTSLTAGTGNHIILDSANNFGGSVTVVSGNNVTLNDTGAIDFAAANVSGNLIVTAGGAITDTGKVDVDGTTNLTAFSGMMGYQEITLNTATNDFTGAVTASGSDITLVDANGIILANVTGTGTVTITALNGNITEDSDATADVTANAVILSATGGGINVDTNAVSVAFTATGNVFIDEVAAGGDLSVSGMTTANNGNIDIETMDGTLTVNGALTAHGSGNISLTASDVGAASNNDVIISGAVTSTSGDITILADNSITLTAGANVLATSTTVGDIVLTATGGAITGTATNLITGNTLAMTANTGIGVFDTAPIMSMVNTLAATTVTGDIMVWNTGALEIGTIGALSGVTITTGGVGNDILVAAASPLTINAEVTNTGGGDIHLGALGVLATDDLTVNANVTATGGDGEIILVAGDSVAIQGVTVISAAGDGNVTVAAGLDVTVVEALGSNTGSVNMAGGSRIQSGSGDITITARENVVLGTLTTTGNATVVADYSYSVYGLAGSDGVGYIRESKGGETANITANVVTLSAATGIGEDDGIDLNATSVSAANSTSGDIRLNEVAAGTALTVTSVSNAANGDIDIRTENGSLTVTGPVATSGTGAVDLVAAGGNLILQSTVGAASGDITLTSTSGDVTFTAAADITTTTGSIEVSANAGAITMATTALNVDGTVINAGSGFIDLHSQGNITLGRLVTTNATDNAVDNAIMISTSLGNLIDGGDFGGADIQAVGGLTLNIAGSIGLTSVAPAANAAIETNVASLTVTAGGGVAINQTGSVVLDMNVAGDITVTVTDGTLTANNVIATGAGNIILTTLETVEGTASNVNLIVGTITAADDTVTLNSADAITQQAASAGVTAATLNMNVQGGIGASGSEIKTTVGTINAASTSVVNAVSTAAGLFITETDAVILNSVTTANGNIAVIAGGTITATTVAANTAGNNVTLTANGVASDVLLGSVTATGGTAMITAGDQILDNDLVGETANVTASIVDLNAGGGIGSAAANGDIDLVATTLTADTTAGVINLANAPTGTVTINSMTTGNASDITYKQTGQNLIIAGAISSGGGDIWIDPPVDIAINANVTTTDLGTILIQGSGAISVANGVTVSTDQGSLTIEGAAAGLEAVSLTMADNSNIFSTAGDITLRANTMTLDNVGTGSDVLLDSNAAAGAVSVQLAGTPGKVTANNLTVNQDAASNITLKTNVTSLDVVNGATVTVREDNDIVINSVATVTSFLLNAENGQVSGNGGNDVTATNLEVRAANGISLNTAVANLAVDNTTSGNVAIVEADGVTLGTALGNTNAANVVGDATMTNLTHSQVFRNQAADGLLTLSTTNGPINTSTAAVTSNGGTITFTANDTSAGTQLANITVGSGNIVSNDGDISLYAADSVALGGNVNAGSGNVNIEANSTSANETTADNIGAITRTAGTVTGDSLDLMAATGIGVLPSTGGTAIYTNADFISAMNTNAGNISINELNGVTLTDIEAANGSVDLTAGGTIIVLGAPGVGITATGGSVTLDANGVAADIQVHNAVIATGGGVTMTADNDIIFTALGDVTANGNVVITADADLGGANSGEITMADGTVIDATAGAITLTSDGTVTLGSLVTANNTNTAVSITSREGAVVDAGDAAGHLNVDADAGRLVISSVTGVGSANALETRVASLDVNNTTSGNVQILESTGVDVQRIATLLGNIALTTTNGSVDVLTGGSGVTTTGTGTIALDANGALADLSVNAGISNVSGNITLTADRNVSFAAAGDVTSTSGNVSVTADADDLTAAGDGTLTMADGALINAGSGTITLFADGDVTLGGLLTTNANNTVTTPAVAVTSVTGAIVDGGDTDREVVAATGALVLNAATGIGSANALETTVARIFANSSASGNIRIAEADAVEVFRLATVGGNIDLTTTSGSVTLLDSATVAAAGSLVSGISTTVAGTINVDVNGATSDLTVNAAVTNNGGSGTIILAADRNVAFSADGDVTSGSGNVTVLADADNQVAGQSGILTMADGTLINAGTATITMRAEGNITLGGLLTTHAGTAGNLSVNMRSDSGSIVDGGDTYVDVSAANGAIFMGAATGIGAGNAIETSALHIAAITTTGGVNLANNSATDTAIRLQSTTSGNLVFNQTGAADTLVVERAWAGAGNVTINATGAATDIVLGGATLAALVPGVDQINGQTVRLAAGHSILDRNDATPSVMNITASVAAYLRAENGTIGEHALNVGQTTNPIEITTPVVSVASANTNALIYANLSGTVGLNTILMENPWPYGNNWPQGTRMLNGQMLYPIQVPGVNSEAEPAAQASLGLTLIGGDGAQGIGAYPQPASVVGSTLETLYSTQAPARLFNSRDPQSIIFEPIMTLSGTGIAVPTNVGDDDAAARRRRMAKK